MAQISIMPTSLAQKLKIKEGTTLLTLNAPANFKKQLGPIPAGVKIITSGKDYDQIHWFVTNKAQMEKELSKTIKLIKADVVFWIYYPKGSSGIQTDFTRDKGWDALMKHEKHNELTWLALISFDDTWSTFALRLKTSADKKKESKPAVREIFNWVNPQTKEVRLPDDLTAAFKKNKKAGDLFNALSFTNKKEYIEWIVTAKQEKTRTERVNGTIERLIKAWKNPRNM